MKHAGANCPVGHSFYAKRSIPSAELEADEQFTRIVTVNGFVVEVEKIAPNKKAVTLRGRDSLRAAAVLRRCGWEVVTT